MPGKKASDLTYGGRRKVVCDDIREESGSQKKQGFAGQSKKLRWEAIRGFKWEGGMIMIYSFAK